MKYNLINQDSGSIDPDGDLEQKIILLRGTLDEKIMEITKDWDCSEKHRIIENVAFNIWRYELIVLNEIDKEYALEILKNDFEIMHDTIKE